MIVTANGDIPLGEFNTYEEAKRRSEEWHRNNPRDNRLTTEREIKLPLTAIDAIKDAKCAVDRAKRIREEGGLKEYSPKERKLGDTLREYRDQVKMIYEQVSSAKETLVSSATDKSDRQFREMNDLINAYNIEANAFNAQARPTGVPEVPTILPVFVLTDSKTQEGIPLFGGLLPEQPRQNVQRPMDTAPPPSVAAKGFPSAANQFASDFFNPGQYLRVGTSDRYLIHFYDAQKKVNRTARLSFATREEALSEAQVIAQSHAIRGIRVTPLSPTLAANFDSYTRGQDFSDRRAGAIQFKARLFEDGTKWANDVLDRAGVIKRELESQKERLYAHRKRYGYGGDFSGPSEAAIMDLSGVIDYGGNRNAGMVDYEMLEDIHKRHNELDSLLNAARKKLKELEFVAELKNKEETEYQNALPQFEAYKDRIGKEVYSELHKRANESTGLSQ